MAFIASIRGYRLSNKNGATSIHLKREKPMRHASPLEQKIKQNLPYTRKQKGKIGSNIISLFIGFLP
jgi:hypothetical protein